MFDPREKVAIFIDGANLYAASRSLGFDIDYRKMLKYFNEQGYLLRAYYYTALIEDQEYSSIRPLIDWRFCITRKKNLIGAHERHKQRQLMLLTKCVHFTG